MHNIRTRAEKLKSKAGARNRTTIASKRLQDVPTGKRVSLSPEMNRLAAANNLPDTISEDEIRRSELAKHAHLLRKPALVRRSSASSKAASLRGETALRSL
jgi:hypothetical protein